MSNASKPQPKQWIVDALHAGDVICNIGQVDQPTARHLDKLVRTGVAIKWRGYWYPVAGASFGIGPLKTCWGLSSKFAAEAA